MEQWTLIFVIIVIGLVGYKIWYYWDVSTPMPFTNAIDPDVVRVKRLLGNPIITYDMDPSLIREAEQYGYININGPSIIRVPAWVENPLGKYYLYFAHHKGDYIKLAFANHPTGPWKIYADGVLHVKNPYFATTAPSYKASKAIKGLWKRVGPTKYWTLLRVGRAVRRASKGM